MKNVIITVLISVIVFAIGTLITNKSGVSILGTVDYVTEDSYQQLLTETEADKVKELVGDYYVAKWGDDSNDASSWETAVKTIQVAIDMCSSNETILVGPGLYNTVGTNAWSDAVICGTTNLTITIKSIAGPDQTIIDGTKTNRCVMGGSLALTTDPYGYLTVDGFSLINGNNEQYGGIIANANTENCILDNNNTSGTYALGGTHNNAIFRNGYIASGRYIVWAKSNWDSNPLLRSGKIRIKNSVVKNFNIINFGAIGYSAYYNGIEFYNCIFNNIKADHVFFGSFVYLYDCEIYNGEIQTPYNTRTLVQGYNYLYRTEIQNFSQNATGSTDFGQNGGTRTLEDVSFIGCSINGVKQPNLIVGIDTQTDGDFELGGNDNLTINGADVSFDGTNWFTNIDGTLYTFDLTPVP